ncbi:ArnT family glycosyltransferase [Thiolapillus sp.]
MTARQASSVYLAAAVASILLSLWQIAGVQQINHDAVYYLLAIEGDADAMRQIGNWLFYSWLIGGTAAIAGLAPEQAAWAVNTLLDTLAVLAFLRLVQELGGKRRTLIWAALVVLTLPYFNDNRAEIIRDHGYWAFSLIAMIFYLRLFRRFSWKHALGWNLAMFVALLFRVEALAFLLLMPLGLLASGSGSLRNTVKTLLPILVAGLGAGFWQLLTGSMENRLADSLANMEQLALVFTDHIPHRAALLRKGAIPEFSRSMAETTLYLAVAWSIVKDLVTSMSWLYAGIFLLRRWFPAPALPTGYSRILWLYAGLTAIILFIHGAQHFIMVSRYTQALALMLLPVVVFSLDELHRKYREENRGGPLLAMTMLGMFVLAADSLHGSSTPKTYILDAAEWARNNIPDRSRIITDYHRERVSWYSNRTGEKQLEFQQFRPGKTWLKDFDYAFVRSGKKLENSRLYQVLSAKGMKPVVRIEPEKGNGVLIYRLKSPPDARATAQ